MRRARSGGLAPAPLAVAAGTRGTDWSRDGMWPPASITFSVPLGLAFTCLFAAVPGGVVSAPFSVVLLAAFVTQVGAPQTAPILIAVVTAFLTMECVKYLRASRKQAHAAAAKPAAPA